MAWDDTIPADNTRWDVAAGQIRDNWAFMETKWGEDLAFSSNVINVQSPPYNATGDGTTDDTTAIQSAITAANAAGGGVVFFPSDVYFVATLRPRSNVILLGEGGSEFKADAGFDILNTDEAIDDFTVDKMIFNGQGSNVKGFFSNEATSTNVHIKNCEFKDCGGLGADGGAIDIEGMNKLSITGNYIHDCKQGIIVSNTSNLTISQNGCYDIGPGAANGEAGIFVWATSDAAGSDTVEFVVISDNICDNCTDNGIRLTSQGTIGDGLTTGTIRYVTVSGNLVRNVGRDCFRIDASYMTVDGNVAIDPANGGIRSNGCTNTVISNNIVTTQTERPSNISAGITVGMPSAGSPGGEISITGNVIDGDQFENGIWIWGDSGVGSQGNGVVIDGNTIVQTGTDSPASPRYAITVFRWDNAVVSGNRINDAFEGISVASSENSSINGNSVTNCVGGAGRGIRTDGVTDCVVYNNVSNGNTIAYELDSDDTTGTVKRDGIALDNTGTPSVLGSHIFITGGTTAITNFEDGFKYQTITILAEHSVTITNNATIILSAGANFNMTDTDSLDLIRKVDGNWYETSRSVN